jgi:hypothetical protein
MSQKGRKDNLTYRGVMNNAVIAMRKAGGVASDLFHLARRAESQDAWEAQCQIEEEWVLSEDAGQMKCIELPKCWTQARSDIRGAYRAGLDLTKIPSYYKMKLAKAEKNKKDKQPDNVVEIVATEQPDDGVIVLDVQPAEDEPRARRPRGEKDARGPRSDSVTTVEEALEAGDVIDAKTNVICPAELLPLVALLNKMDELTRSRMIKRFTKEANIAWSKQCQARKQGQQHAAS